MQDRRSGSWRQDDAGVIVPFGTHGGEKELLRKGKDAAETLARGRLSHEEASLLALIKSIAEDDLGTDDFVINMVLASMGEQGFARNEYLMGLARMLVPSAMPAAHPLSYAQNRRDGRNQPPKTKEADLE